MHLFREKMHTKGTKGILRVKSQRTHNNHSHNAVLQGHKHQITENELDTFQKLSKCSLSICDRERFPHNEVWLSLKPFLMTCWVV